MQVDMTLDQMVSSNWGDSARPEVLGRRWLPLGYCCLVYKTTLAAATSKPASSHCLQTRTARGMPWSPLAPLAGGVGAELERVCPVLPGAR